MIKQQGTEDRLQVTVKTLETVESSCHATASNAMFIHKTCQKVSNIVMAKKLNI